VVGFERTSSGTSGNHVHHGGLNFNEIVLHHECTEFGNDFVTGLEDFFDIVVHNEVKVALSVAGVLVENVFVSFSLREHVHAVAETGDTDGANRKLTSLRASGNTLNTNHITSAERSVELVEFTTVVSSIGKDLELLGVTLNINENKLSS